MNKSRLDCFRYASLGEVFELGSNTMYPMLTISAVGLFIERPFGDFGDSTLTFQAIKGLALRCIHYFQTPLIFLNYDYDVSAYQLTSSFPAPTTWTSYP